MTAGDGFAVTAFGKHPGWADHIDDIPIQTAELKLARELLYAHGIRRVIDRGGWVELADERRLSGFDHWFLWYLEGAVIVGRMVRSTDASGRSAYPFVVCAQVPASFASWIVDQGGPILERLGTRCQACTESEEVTRAVGEAHEELLSMSEGAEQLPRETTRTADSIQGENPGSEGVYRILYQIEREMRAYGAAGGGTISEKLDPSPRHIRLPGRGGWALEDLAHWAGFMREHLAPGASILAICPVEASWCDVIVGELDDGSLVPMMMNESGMRPASETAYELEDDFVARADEAIGRSVGQIAEREQAGLEGLRRATGAMRKGADAARSKGLGLRRWLRGKSGS